MSEGTQNYDCLTAVLVHDDRGPVVVDCGVGLGVDAAVAVAVGEEHGDPAHGVSGAGVEASILVS